jgi:arylsulfatase A
MKCNVVFIMADDMGYGDFGIFNNGPAKTPALDQLIEQGLCLTQHYSASCVCTPARAGLLTGRYPHRTGAIEMRSIRGLDRLGLRERTMGDFFKSCSYATGLVGKWHTGVYGDEYHPNRRGFDEFVGFRGGSMHYFDWRIERNGEVVPNDGQYLTDLLTEEAVSFIRRHAKEPFFLCLHYNAPHAPLHAPQEDIEKFLDPEISRGVSILYAMIYRMDKGIEKIRTELADLGIAENTIFLFTSDNGPAFYDWQGLSQQRYNCGFSGSKGSVFEGGIRVPMILYWPEGGITGGRRFDDFVHFTDWLPTLAAAAEQEIPDGPNLDGCNVLPALLGEGGKVNPTRFWQWNRYTPLVTCNAAMRDGPWKLVQPAIKEAMWTSPDEMALDRQYEMNPETFTDILRTPEPERNLSDPAPVELYNIKQDPCETENLADKHPDKVLKMKTALETWFEEVEEERRGNSS